MKIITKRVVDLTGHEYNRLCELTYGKSGYMQEDLDSAIDEEFGKKMHRYTQAIMITESNQILGWCLLQPIACTARYLAYFYVDPAHRRKGLGTKLLKEANKWGRYRVGVMADFTNYGFFNKHPSLHKGYS